VSEPLFTYSASRGKVIDGEKGQPGCERRYAGQYIFGFKQSTTAALANGSELHAKAEHLQLTGELLDPESDMSVLLASGAHLLGMCGPLLVEHEHRGELPDGTPYVAYLDGQSERALNGTGTVIVQDLKTCGSPRFALRGLDQDDDTGEDMSPDYRALRGARALDSDPFALRNDGQAMFYAWILLCAPAHWFAPTLPEGHYGPQHWQWWDPKEREARSCRLRWLYFLTNGNPRAWEETDWVMPAQATAYMNTKILPAVARITAIHRWRLANPSATLDELDRTPAACNNKGRWCGTYEHDACNFEQIGTPINDLIQLRVRKPMTPAERLAQLRGEVAATPVAPTAAAPAPEAPAASPPPAAAADPSPVAVTSEPAPVAAPVSEKAAPGAAAAELTRGQKAAATRAATRAANKAAAAATPAAALGAGVNPPEAKEALAKLASEAAGLVAAPESTTNQVTVPVAVVTLIGVDEIAAFLVSQGYAVSKGGAQ
jgi:hypothetical protein